VIRFGADPVPESGSFNGCVKITDAGGRVFISNDAALSGNTVVLNDYDATNFVDGCAVSVTGVTV